ncbi:MAG: transketolase C-terminal domain-containing protein, partial [Cyanobacteria bacterium J06588_5]
YSTFLQRGFDQIVHDVCIQKLPVFLALDRAGIVGVDGPTHQGMYDIAYLRCIPNLVLMAPKDEAELQRMVVTGIDYDGPIAVRYPRGSGYGVPIMESGWEKLPIGKAEVLRQGDDVLLVGYGSMVYSAMQTAEILSEHGVEATVVNARFAKPLDTELMLPLIEKIGRVATMEDGCIMGGFGSALAETLFDAKMTPDLIRLGVPDVLVDHASPDQSKAELGLMPAQMAERILKQFELGEAHRELAEQV